MAEPKSAANEIEISRERLAELLNEDLSREYQAIIAYVVYSQVLSGAQYMDIAAQLEIHAKQELDHALILSRQIDYLGKMPVVTPQPVRTSKNPKDMLRYDLDNENETIRNYRDRIRQCEALGEYAMAEQIRQILMQEQDHQIDLATALGEEVPDVSKGPKGRTLLTEMSFIRFLNLPRLAGETRSAQSPSWTSLVDSLPIVLCGLADPRLDPLGVS